MNDAGNDTRFCREHAFVGNPLYRVTSILAPQKSRQLTALHAVFDLLQRIGRRAQEEGAARVQLAWWREECLAGDPAHSDHPALRELHKDGEGRLDSPAFARLVDRIEYRLERPAMTDVEALWKFCAAQGQPLLELETALWPGGAHPAGDDDGLAARRGLWSLLTDCFIAGEKPDAWWAPLDLLARTELKRSEIFAPERASEAARMFAGIFSFAGFASARKIDISEIKQPVVHINLMDFLVSRTLRSASGAAPPDIRRALVRVRVRDFLAAWSLARRVSRRR